MLRWILLLFPLLLGLAACSAMSVQECQTANWQQVGESDGYNGNSSRIASYYKSCEKAGLVPNQKLYEQGYAKGQQYYCQPNIIFEKSLAGSGSYSACPIETHSRLKPYYENAHRFYEAERNWKSLNKDLVRYQDYLLDKKLSVEKRNEYINKIRDLKYEVEKADIEYSRADQALRRFKRANGL